MRFGVQLSLKPPAEQFELVRRVEALGFESVWTGDHVSFHNPMYEALTLLATYVPITSRIRLGTAVYLLALRTPAIAAKITSTLDALSGGRLIFGVGVGGENPKEFEVVGVPHQERGARVTEGIDVVRTLWRDTPASFHGRFTQFDGGLARSQARAEAGTAHLDRRPLRRRADPGRPPGRRLGVVRRAGRTLRAERGQDPRRPRRGRSLDGFAFAHLGFITVGRDWESAKAVWAQALTQAVRAGLRAARAQVRDHRHARAVRRADRALRGGRLQLHDRQPDRRSQGRARSGRADRGRRPASAALRERHQGGVAPAASARCPRSRCVPRSRDRGTRAGVRGARSRARD